MEWITTKQRSSKEWINPFNHYGGSNPQNKWPITFFKFVLKCHPKVLDSNERLNIRTRRKGCHKCNPYSKIDNQESNLIHKITMYELVSTPYNIIWLISSQYITFKTSTQHYLLYVNDTYNKNRWCSFFAWANNDLCHWSNNKTQIYNKKRFSRIG